MSGIGDQHADIRIADLRDHRGHRQTGVKRPTTVGGLPSSTLAAGHGVVPQAAID
jgi:hypothetical protein